MFPSLSDARPQRLLAGIGDRAPATRWTHKAGEQSPNVNVGVMFLNGTASAGSHNVILGLRRYLDNIDGVTGNLWGILSLTRGNELQLTCEVVSQYLNQGGSDLLPSVNLQRVNDRCLQQLKKISERLDLHDLVFVCGASDVLEIAKLADGFARLSMSTRLVGVVHSAAGVLRLPEWVPTNLGFDSACSVLAEITGNISLSRQSLRYDLYHFICCGNPALTLECAMQTHPTLCFISDDLAERRSTLDDILNEICDVIVARHHDHGLSSGVILVSDGFFEALREMQQLRDEIHRLRRDQTANVNSVESTMEVLSPSLRASFEMLPTENRHQLVFNAALDGSPLLRVKEPERELGTLVEQRLATRRAGGDHRSVKQFSLSAHNLRQLCVSPMPTPLDCEMGYALGHAAARMLEHGVHGCIASITNPTAPCVDWDICAVPLVRLLEASISEVAIPDQRGGQNQPEHVAIPRQFRLVPGDALFDLWRRAQAQWRYRQSYRQPGPIQYWGPGGVRDQKWASYTLRAQAACDLTGIGTTKCFDVVDILAKECIPKEGPATGIIVQAAGSSRQLQPREAHLLSPLQQWRIEYQPGLPAVLQGVFKITEDENRTRVCSDSRVVNAAFPNLWRATDMKDFTIEPVGDDDGGVLQLLADEKLSATPVTKRALPMVREDWKREDSSERLVLLSELRTSASMVKMSCSVGDASAGEMSVEDLSDMELDLTSDNALRHESLRVGIVLVGRAGPGVNNVIQGLFDYVKALNGSLYCVPMGIAGLVSGYAFEITEELLRPFRNQGGCDLLGQSQPEDLLRLGSDFAACAQTVRNYKLDGLVVWGGRNVHSWTPRLSEWFVEHKVQTVVIGVPASVQSDLPLIEQTLGYDSMCKLLASIVGNLATQAASSGKTWYFVRIAGRSISHIAAEVALLTHPHVVLTSSFSGDNNLDQLGLPEVTQMICDVIEARSKEGKNYGVVLIPDQMLASVREMRQLLEEMQEIVRMCPEVLDSIESGVTRDFGPLLGLLSPLSRSLLSSFPERVRAQICALVYEESTERVLSQGNQGELEPLDLSNVDTEVIFKTLVESELTRRVVNKTYTGPFHAMTYSMAYMGRSAMPTNFDCDLGYTIGYAAGIFVDVQHTGLLINVTKLKEDVSNWEVIGSPLSSFLTFQDDESSFSHEQADQGVSTIGLPKRSSSRSCLPMTEPYAIRPRTRLHYDLRFEVNMPPPIERMVISPGPAQFDGPCACAKTQSLCMPHVVRVRQMAITEQLITELKMKASAGCPPEVLQAVKMLLQGGTRLLRQHMESA